MNRAFFFILAAAVFLIQSLEAQWVKVSNGMGNLTVYSLEEEGFKIFAGTTNGVYLSTNNCASWSQTSLNNKCIKSLAITGGIIFAGTENQDSNAVYISFNYGVSWILSGLTGQKIHSLAARGEDIFAATDNGLYFSTDYGSNFIQYYLSSQTVRSVFFGDFLYVGTNDSGVYMTTDEGEFWTHTSIRDGTVQSFCVCGVDVFAGTPDKGVYFSTNNGLKWAPTSLVDRNVLSLTRDLVNVFAGAQFNGFYFSTDYGTHWLQNNDGFYQNPTIYSLKLINGFNDLLASTDSSVWKRSVEGIIGIKKISKDIPLNFNLHQNFPNPFNPTTDILFDLPKAGIVKLSIFDALGRTIETPLNGRMQAGTYKFEWKAANFPSGIYFYRIETSKFTDTKKMVLIK